MSFFDRFREDDENAWVRSIARELDTEPDRESVEHRIRDLSRAIDTLVAAADLRHHVSDPPAPDAGSVEKAQALASAVRTSEIDIGPDDSVGSPGRVEGSNQGEGPSVLEASARRVRADRTPSSGRARELLACVVRPHDVGGAEANDVLAGVVDELDERSTVLRALGDFDPSVPGEATAAKRALGSGEGELIGIVRRMLDALESHQEGADGADATLNRIETVADSLCNRIEEEAEWAVDADTSAGRLERLLEDIERAELAVVSDAGDHAATAIKVRQEVDPHSPLATRLLDQLASGGGIDDPLSQTVARLDSMETNRSIAGDVDRDEVRSLAEEAAAEVRRLDHPATDVLADRIDELKRMVSRADESNTVLPYAALQELRFYDRTFLDAISEGGEDDTSADTVSSGELQTWMTDIADRREGIETRHVEAKDDHNHVFPRHFLSLVDELISQAERLESSGEHTKAAGVLEAVDRLLDGIETLYERNELSVMLRQLRG